MKTFRYKTIDFIVFYANAKNFVAIKNPLLYIEQFVNKTGTEKNLPEESESEKLIC